MTRRAARRRRWKFAIVGVAIAGGLVAWWVRSGGSLPSLQAESEAPPAPASLATPSVAATPVVTTPPAPVAVPPHAQVVDLEAEQARDAEWAAARRESIRVQQRLRQEAAEQRARAEALETGDDIRCIEGRRMRRVSNGWVDAGTC